MASRIWIKLGVVAAMVVMLAAAACGSASPAALAPPEAAATLAQNLALSDDQAACMLEQFERAPSAAAVLDTAEPPSDDDRDLFLAAIRTCLPPDAFGTSLAATVREELPEATDAQAACVRDNVVALAAPEQDRLYLYFSNPATLDVADVGPAGADLLASCDLGGADDEPETTGVSSASTTPAPG